MLQWAVLPTNKANSMPSDVQSPSASGNSSVLTCPACHADKIAKSRVQGLEKLLILFISRRPYQCLRCYHRFWHREKVKNGMFRFLILIFLAVLLLFIAFPEIKTVVYSDSPAPQHTTQLIGSVDTSSLGAPSQVQAKQDRSQTASTIKPVQKTVLPADSNDPGVERVFIENMSFNKPRLQNSDVGVDLQNQSSASTSLNIEPAEALSLLRVEISHRFEQ